MYKPTKIGKILLKPVWEDYEPLENEMVIELDQACFSTEPITQEYYLALKSM